MKQTPQKQIANDAIKAWQISASIQLSIGILIGIIILILGNVFSFSYWYGIGFFGLDIILGTITIFIIPKLRWRRWRYEIFDQEIYIQYGILIVTRTLVPMARVQHVDTKQGPILKKYDLASLTISTAATVHEIPALLEHEAYGLRDQISELARVEQDDV
ncbi:hypothetical protein Pryu01_02394 [Paraliobacillus ryukyuensis]|uniref:YdbS-like PH domain-containing protein n=1 Tax=Paraliobacillus ryukyuensis TaxID=200904 RepID=A0A366DWZ3_9BACI|nr:PH domain-containing protein [Paraliobacillus ryukyuensis]RBO94610.1 hypothetical protein DES48_11097 [Paraliobacillus ryukyuensis]